MFFLKGEPLKPIGYLEEILADKPSWDPRGAFDQKLPERWQEQWIGSYRRVYRDLNQMLFVDRRMGELKNFAPLEDHLSQSVYDCFRIYPPTTEYRATLFRGRTLLFHIPITFLRQRKETDPLWYIRPYDIDLTPMFTAFQLTTGFRGRRVKELSGNRLIKLSADFLSLDGSALAETYQISKQISEELRILIPDRADDPDEINYVRQLLEAKAVRLANERIENPPLTSSSYPR